MDTWGFESSQSGQHCPIKLVVDCLFRKQNAEARFLYWAPNIITPRWWNWKTRQFQKLMPTRPRSSSLLRGTKF